MISLFLFQRVVSARKLAGAILGFIGVVLIVGIDALEGFDASVAGQIAALAGAAMYAAAALYGQRFSALPSGVTAVVTMLWSMLILLPAALIVDKPWLLSPSLKAIAAALSLSVFSTAVALLIYFRLLKTLGAIGTASQAYLRAGVGVVLGVVILGQQLTSIVVTGLLLALVGVVMINYPQKVSA